MSMPELPKPNPDLTQEQALTMILTSIAMEELGLSHIINAEGEKIQYILARKTPCGQNASDVDEVLAVNKSVTSLLEMVLQNQMILKNKMEKVLEYLPGPPQPNPPKPPLPPEPPCLPEPSQPKSCQVSFDILPGLYGCNEPLRWYGGGVCDSFSMVPADNTKIGMPRTGTFMVEICGDYVSDYCQSNRLEFMVVCQDKEPITKTIYPDKWCSQCPKHKSTTIQMPCSCSRCYGTVLACTPGGLCVRQGRLIFTKLY